MNEEEEKKNKKRLLLLLLLLLLFIVAIIGTVMFLKDDGKAEASEEEISIASEQEANTNEENKVEENSNNDNVQTMTQLFALNKSKIKNASSNANSNTNSNENSSTNASQKTKDTKAPEISGVEDNKWYDNSISVTIRDDSDYTATLTDKDGNTVAYTSETEITKEGEYTLTVTDSEGNETSVVFGIDTTVPRIEVIGNPTVWQNVDATLTIKASDDLSGVKSVTVNGEDITGQGTYTVSENGTYEFTVTDGVKNESTTTVVVDKIDITAPTIEVTGNMAVWQNVDATLTIKASDDLSGVKSVTVNGEDITGQGTYTVSENGTYEFTVIDNAGNEATQAVVVDKIDKIAPTVSVNSQMGFLMINARDNESGVKSVVIKANGQERTLTGYNGQYFYMPSQRPGTTIGYYELTATDNAGNKTIKTNDTTAPVLNVTGNPRQWLNLDVMLTIAASDDLSGVKSVTVNGEDITGQGTYTVTENGTYEFIATDNAGNEATQAVVVDKIDKIAPTVSVNSQMGFLMINARDNESGVKSVVIKANGQERTLTGYNGQYFYMPSQRPGTTIGYYELTVIDNAGNKTIDSNDKTAPLLNVTGNPTVWQNANVTLTIAASDDLSGVKSVMVNGEDITGQETYIVSENGTYEFTVTDNAGYETTQTIVVDKIDKTAPILNVTGNPTVWQNANVTLTIQASDNLSEIKSLTVNGEDITSQGTYTVSVNGTYVFVAIDNAGNKTTQTVVVNKIDKTAPTVSASRQGRNLRVNATDSESGIKSVIVNGEDITSTLSNGRYTHRLNNSGQSYSIIVTDNAGNTTTYNS